MSVYDTIIDHLHDNLDKNTKQQERVVPKGRRPLKMPKNYDFTTRNVNWRQYSNDYLLRTDAVWEKSKLMDVFYTNYKVRLALFNSIIVSILV